MFKFIHLVKVNQTYIAHFIDSIQYSMKAQKASCYFFLHALYPDVCIKDGSQTISHLHYEISSKYSKVDSFQKDIRK
jgi:hypothetical protein